MVLWKKVAVDTRDRISINISDRGSYVKYWRSVSPLLKNETIEKITWRIINSRVKMLIVFLHGNRRINPDSNIPIAKYNARIIFSLLI